MEALHLIERERLVIHEGGYIIGREDGLAEGRTEGKNEVAKTMLADGVPPEKVAKYTGLTLTEVKGL